jgi:hypothetical protein
MQIPYVKLSPSEESYCLSALVQGSVFLRRWASHLGKKKAIEFRKLLFKAAKNETLMKELECKIPTEELAEFRLERKFIISIHADKQPCLDGRTIEWAMLCGFSALARKHARRWHAHENHSTGMLLEDYENESYLTILDCIYAYSDPSIKFSSFAWRALRNKLIGVTNKNTLFCPLSKEDVNLLQSYDKTKLDLNGPCNFDQVVTKMGLDAEQRQQLILATTRMILESQMLLPDKGSQENNEDYTAKRLGIDSCADKKLFVLEIKEAIIRAKLTDFEKQVLEASFDASYGWVAEFARTNINPKTNRPYSRMWIGVVLNDIYSKIRKQLEEKVDFVELLEKKI